MSEHWKNAIWRLKERMSIPDVPVPSRFESTTPLSEDQSKSLDELLKRLELWWSATDGDSLGEKLVQDPSFQEQAASFMESICAEWRGASADNSQRERTSPYDRYFLGVRELRPTLRLAGKGHSEIEDGYAVHQWWEVIGKAWEAHPGAINSTPHT